MGIVISQFKDPYEPISIMECHKGFERGSSCLFFVKGIGVAVGEDPAGCSW